MSPCPSSSSAASAKTACIPTQCCGDDHNHCKESHTRDTMKGIWESGTDGMYQQQQRQPCSCSLTGKIYDPFEHPALSESSCSCLVMCMNLPSTRLSFPGISWQDFELSVSMTKLSCSLAKLTDSLIVFQMMIN